jgi:hypothetical protein
MTGAIISFWWADICQNPHTPILRAIQAVGGDLSQRRFLADYIVSMFEFDFRQGQEDIQGSGAFCRH